MERSSGVLLHISSLPSPYGIGSFGQEAYNFVDFLVEGDQTYWQILPLTTTTYGDSPYQSFSAFAGNINFIDLNMLRDMGYIDQVDLTRLASQEASFLVDYAFIYQERRPVLERAVSTFLKKANKSEREKFEAFKQEESHWLNDFVIFMTLKESQNMKAWYEWPEDLQKIEANKLCEMLSTNKDISLYYEVTQYWFYEQWRALKDYANQKNIYIIGDMPIYVAYDSVEMWGQKELFLLDEDDHPLEIAGVPPDNFNDNGQLWGNPIYDWASMKSDGYSWWKMRLEDAFKKYDLLRLDHFRGFESYWAVSPASKTAADGQWKKGPGRDFFDSLKKDGKDYPIIAEDLGYMTQDVIDLLNETGYPGMKVMLFGFNGKEDSRDLPHQYPAHSVAYVGTHDNETAEGWYTESASDLQRSQADAYLHRHAGESISQAMNRVLASSASNLIIYQMQDLLGLGNEARMNEPASIGKNWRWRLLADRLNQGIIDQIKEWTDMYFRSNPYRKQVKSDGT